MKLRFGFFLTLLLFLLVSAGHLSAQHTMVYKQMPPVIKKNVTMIVRKPDRARDIALRFHITPKQLSKLNKKVHREDIMYSGKPLIIPVWLKRKNTGHESSDFAITDYTIDLDSVDYYVSEDFICMVDIESDTVRRAAIDREIKKLDRQIEGVNYLMDSIEDYGRHNLSQRDIRKMPLARARHSGVFAIGAQIDTLMMQRNQVSDERAKIEMRVEDYECLIENARYNASHISPDDIRAIDLREADRDHNNVKTSTDKHKNR